MSTSNSKNISSDLFNLLIYLHSKLFNPSGLAKSCSMPPSHMKVMFHLRHKRSSSVSEIAKRLLISKPNMTPIIDKLLSDGYVHRYNNPDDRRIIMVELTSKGEDFLKDQAQHMKDKLTDIISPLSDEDLDRLDESVKTMLNIMSKLK